MTPPSESGSYPRDPKGSTPAPKGLRERKIAKTRAAIQRHGLALFRTQGYAQTTVDQIADEAEISPSTFFRYFPAKEDVVLQEFIDVAFFEAFNAQPPELSPVDALRGAIRAVYNSMSDDDLALEWERNELIMSVPELRRGMLDELTRPLGLLTQALAARLGRSEEDSALRAYTGALLGGIMAVTLPSSGELPDSGDWLASLDTALDEVERILSL